MQTIGPKLRKTLALFLVLSLVIDPLTEVNFQPTPTSSASSQVFNAQTMVPALIASVYLGTGLGQLYTATFKLSETAKRTILEKQELSQWSFRFALETLWIILGYLLKQLRILLSQINAMQPFATPRGGSNPQSRNPDIDRTRERFQMLRDRSGIHSFTNNSPHEKRRMTGEKDADKSPVFERLDLGDPTNWTPEKLLPIVNRLSNQNNKKTKSQRELAERISERLIQLGELQSLDQLRGVKGLGTAWSEIKLYVSLGETSSDVEFPQQPPSRIELEQFEHRYKLVTVKSSQLVPVVHVPGYADFSEDTLMRYLGIAEQKAAALHSHSNRGSGSIFSPLEGEWERGFQIDWAFLDSQVRRFFSSLPEFERTFFKEFIQKHFPSSLFGKYTSFLVAPLADTRQILDAAHWQDISNITSMFDVFTEAVEFFKGSQVQQYIDPMVSIYAYLWNADPRLGICLPGKFFLSLKRTDPSLAERHEAWAMTSEGRAFYEALRQINPDVRKILQGGAWPRDQFAYVTSELGVYDKHKLDTSVRDIKKSRHTLGLQHGGALIPGRFRTDIVFVSSDILEAERRVMAWKLKDRNTVVYSLPPGFFTIETAGKRYWVTNPHIDTVINVVDAEFTKINRSKLLIDPFYYDGIKENPQFKKFLAEQRVSEHDIVVIDEQDVGLNLANFTVIPNTQGEKRILFNGQSKTVARLGLKPGVALELNPPIRVLTIKGGLQRCLTQLLPIDRVPRRRAVLDVDIDEELEPSLRAMVQREIAGWQKRLSSSGLEKLSVLYGPGSAVDFNWSTLPREVLVSIPMRGARPEEVGRALDEIIARCKAVFGPTPPTAPRSEDLDLMSWAPWLIGTAAATTVLRELGASGSEFAMIVPLFWLRKRLLGRSASDGSGLFLRAA